MLFSVNRKSGKTNFYCLYVPSKVLVNKTFKCSLTLTSPFIYNSNLPYLWSDYQVSLGVEPYSKIDYCITQIVGGIGGSSQRILRVPIQMSWTLKLFADVIKYRGVAQYFSNRKKDHSLTSLSLSHTPSQIIYICIKDIYFLMRRLSLMQIVSWENNFGPECSI